MRKRDNPVLDVAQLTEHLAVIEDEQLERQLKLRTYYEPYGEEEGDLLLSAVEWHQQTRKDITDAMMSWFDLRQLVPFNEISTRLVTEKKRGVKYLEQATISTLNDWILRSNAAPSIDQVRVIEDCYDFTRSSNPRAFIGWFEGFRARKASDDEIDCYEIAASWDPTDPFVEEFWGLWESMNLFKTDTIDNGGLVALNRKASTRLQEAPDPRIAFWNNITSDPESLSSTFQALSDGVATKSVDYDASVFHGSLPDSAERFHEWSQGNELVPLMLGLTELNSTIEGRLQLAVLENSNRRLIEKQFVNTFNLDASARWSLEQQNAEGLLSASSIRMDSNVNERRASFVKFKPSKDQYSYWRDHLFSERLRVAAGRVSRRAQADRITREFQRTVSEMTDTRLELERMLQHRKERGLVRNTAEKSGQQS